MQTVPDSITVFRMIDKMDWSEECFQCAEADQKEEMAEKLHRIVTFFNNPETGLLNHDSTDRRPCVDVFRDMILHFKKTGFDSLYSVVQLQHVHPYIKEMTYLLQFLTHYYGCGRERHIHSYHNANKPLILEKLKFLSHCLELINELINAISTSSVVQAKTRLHLSLMSSVMKKINELDFNDDTGLYKYNLQSPNVTDAMKADLKHVSGMYSALNVLLMVIIQMIQRRIH